MKISKEYIELLIRAFPNDMSLGAHIRKEFYETDRKVYNIKSNDTIYYDSRAGHTMVIKGEQYTIITERDVVIVE